jgi:hypothetical protein
MNLWLKNQITLFCGLNALYFGYLKSVFKLGLFAFFGQGSDICGKKLYPMHPLRLFG